VPAQLRALITIGGCSNIRCALTDVKHRVVFLSNVGQKSPHLFFVLRGTKNCLTSVIFAFVFRCRHREADDVHASRAALTSITRKPASLVLCASEGFAGLSPLHPPPLQKADRGFWSRTPCVRANRVGRGARAACTDPLLK